MYRGSDRGRVLRSKTGGNFFERRIRIAGRQAQTVATHISARDQIAGMVLFPVQVRLLLRIGMKD
jgi:hypothetical protein